MPSYPTSLDAISNPASSTQLSDVSLTHSLQHITLNDIAEALEAKLGIGASTPPATAAVLRQTATGASGWGQLLAGDIDPSALLALAAQNPIVNGGFTISQRGSGFPSPVATGAYTIDRWRWTQSGTVAVQITQDVADVPAVAATVPGTYASMRIQIVTADASLVAGDFAIISQAIEGYAWHPYAEKQFSIGFWVKAPVAGTHYVSFRNDSVNRSYPASYTISGGEVNTWAYKTVTISASPNMATPTPGWNTTNGVGLWVGFVLMAGTTYHGTANTWNTGSLHAASGNANGVGVTGDWRFWGVTMGLGSSPPPFWPRPYGQEMLLAKRYYQRLGGTAVADIAHYGYALAGGSIGSSVSFPEMRAIPVATKTGTWGVTNCAQPTVSAIGQSSVTLATTVTASAAANFYTQGATTYVDLNGEY